MNKQMISPMKALKENVKIPFEQARAMPADVYTTDAFHAAELEHIFRKDWFCVGRASTMAEPGEYVTCDLAGEPIVVIRDRDGVLRAMSNVCRHRMSTLLEGSGKVRSIVCPYHAWTYNLDGSLRGAPAMTLNEGFCKDNYQLPTVRCEEWLGWVFVTLNPECEPVAEKLSELEDMISGYGMADYEETFFETHVWDTNWKILAENFMESYHLPVCHAGTIGGFSKLEEMVCPPGHDAFNYHTILKDNSMQIALAHDDNTALVGEERRTTYLLALYPSLVITLTPGYFWYLSLHPNGPGKVNIRFGGGMSKDYMNDPDAKAHFEQLKELLDRVNIEDQGCTEKVFKGLSSAMAEPGHLSHLERPNYEFATYLSKQVNGPDA